MNDKSLDLNLNDVPAQDVLDALTAEIPMGTVNEAGNVCARPPKEVRDILTKMFPPPRVQFGEGGKLSSNIPLTDLAEDELALLNAFAAKVAGVPLNECKINHIDGCHSCYLGMVRRAGCFYARWGNHVSTTCGWQCWQCNMVEMSCPDPKGP